MGERRVRTWLAVPLWRRKEEKEEEFVFLLESIHLFSRIQESVGVSLRYTESSGDLERPLRLQIESELPLLGEARAADLHSESAHPGAAAVQAEVTAHVTKLRVGLDLLPFLDDKQHNVTNIERCTFFGV